MPAKRKAKGRKRSKAPVRRKMGPRKRKAPRKRKVRRGGGIGKKAQNLALAAGAAAAGTGGVIWALKQNDPSSLAAAQRGLKAGIKQLSTALHEL